MPDPSKPVKDSKDTASWLVVSGCGESFRRVGLLPLAYSIVVIGKYCRYDSKFAGNGICPELRTMYTWVGPVDGRHRTGARGSLSRRSVGWSQRGAHVLSSSVSLPHSFAMSDPDLSRRRLSTLLMPCNSEVYLHSANFQRWKICCFQLNISAALVTPVLASARLQPQIFPEVIHPHR